MVEYSKRLRKQSLDSVPQMVTYLFCDWLNIDSKVLIGRVRQVTRDVVKSEV